MVEPEEINKLIQSRVKDLDREVAKLTKELETYQREYRNLIKDIPLDVKDGTLVRSVANYNQALRLNPSNELKLKKIFEDFVSKYDEMVQAQVEHNALLGISTDINFQGTKMIEKAQIVDLESFIGKGAELDDLIKKELINGIAGTANYRTMVRNLEENLLGLGEKGGFLARYSNTYIRTSIQGLTRLVDKEIQDKYIKDNDIEDPKYLYSGVVDGKTRDFCLDHVGKEYTEDEVMGFPGSFFSPGGWNCRHELTLVI